ncbi:MAG: hypothetical protein QOG63_2585 [Thermoleophilaceae bacterium]|jgi:hypothetical protein|nr:hypothetical protein [Thermoleophilaceae bacterium]
MTRHFPRTAIGVALIGAPLLTLVSAIASPAIKGDEAAQVAVIAAHPARYYAFAIFTLAGIILLVPALLGLMQMTRDRAPGWGNVGGTLALLGTLIATGDAATQLLVWQMGAPGADRAEMAALLQRYDEALGSSLVFTIGGLAFLVGTLVLAIGLIRARAVPAVVAIGVFAGVFLNIAGFTAASAGLLIVSSVVLLASLGWIGWRVLSGSVEGGDHALVAAPLGAR